MQSLTYRMIKELVLFQIEQNAVVYLEIKMFLKINK